MTGGFFKGPTRRTSATVNLYEISNTPADGAMTSVPMTDLASFRYLLYLSPSNGFGNVAEVQFYSLSPQFEQVDRAIIGTSGWWNTNGNTNTMAWMAIWPPISTPPAPAMATGWDWTWASPRS